MAVFVAEVKGPSTTAAMGPVLEDSTGTGR